MPLQKSKKEQIIKDLDQALEKSKSLVFVNFRGMTVGNETLLRKALRAQEVSYKVARKTLLKRALAGKAEGELPELGGEVAIAFGEDSIAPAREIHNFEKEHKGMLNILGGIFEGKFVDGAYMKELAQIPSKEVLLSKLAYLLKYPITSLAVVTSEIAKKK